MNIKALIRRYWHSKYVVVTLDDVLPMYGEGDTREEAIEDLLGSLISLRTMLEEDPSNLSPHLADELRILRRLMAPLLPYTITVTNPSQHYTTNASTSR